MFKFKYLIFLFTAHSLYALTTLHVTLSSDSDPGGMGISGELRYCLNTMNQALNTTPDDYEIVFDFPMTIQLNGILPIINNSTNPVTITIGNSGSTPTVTIDGNSTYSGLLIPIGNVMVQNIIFQNMIAQGGNGGDGISGGGGGMGAGGAIYAPEFFLNGTNPAITLINILINDCAAVGGNGGNYKASYSGASSTGDEGGGGGGGFSGNGGSIMTRGSTGGAGGGGFGGDGGNVTLSSNFINGGGGGGGGGIGSRATMGTPTNLGTGGNDNENGFPGSIYGPTIPAGSGGGGNSGGSNAGGGGGGAGNPAGGGGGGSAGLPGQNPQGTTAPGGNAQPSGGSGGDGGGGGGAGVVVLTGFTNGFDGQGGAGGYGGGGGAGAGTGASDLLYTVQGGQGGIGGGGGGGGVNEANATPATGGGSNGGGGPSNGSTASGGTDAGNLGGGAGGNGAGSYGMGSGGGGGGGGSGLGGAIFVDTDLNFTIQAFSGIPTTFNTLNTTTQPGAGGSAGTGGGTNGLDGASLGDSIFLRSGSFLTLTANDAGDMLTLGTGVAFVDDTSFGQGGTNIFVTGNGTVVYEGTANYQGTVNIDNANFKVNGQIENAAINVCRNVSFSSQRGTLSGSGILTGDVFVNSGTISPDTNSTLTLGSLSLSSADPVSGSLGSLVHIEIDSNSTNSGNTSLVSVTGNASLAGILEIDLDPNAQSGTYTILTSSGITGTFDSVAFTGTTPKSYSLSYLPTGSPTFVQFSFLGNPSNILESPSNFQGKQKKNNFGFVYELYNQLTWTPSSSSGVIGYLIYRDGNEIATVSATTYTYQDHNQPQGVTSIYSLVAYDDNGDISSPVTVTVP